MTIRPKKIRTRYGPYKTVDKPKIQAFALAICLPV